MKTRLPLLILLISMLILSCSSKQESIIDMSDVYPWCIVAFDSLQRSPSDRIEMLKVLGFDSYAYDCDIKYLDGMEEELALAKENDIEVTAVWLWLNPKRDSLGKLSPRNQRIFDIVSRSDHKPAFWISFSPDFFKKRSHAESIQYSSEMIHYVHMKAAEIGCDVQIYNHKGWFGDPDNMVEIIKSLPDLNLKMVYNFHHALQDLGDYQRVIKMISPHLASVNINGMRKDGPKILTVGEGDYERRMIQELKANGFEGPWGILGHIKEEDVRVVLERNIAGLKKL